MKIYRAYYESRSFTFEAYSKTEKTARAKCLVALQLHTKQCDLEPDWFIFGDVDGIEVDDYELDTPYRDRSEIK